MEITLKYQKTLLQGYQWFIMYEFSVDSDDLWNKDIHQIFQDIFKTRILHRTLNHPELKGEKLEIHIESPFRPYDFEKVSTADFDLIENEFSFNQLLDDFASTDDWASDLSDFKKLIAQAKSEIKQRTAFDHGCWLINKEKFDANDPKLDEVHWIFNYFLTFIEINKDQRIIRTIDFGYD